MKTILPIHQQHTATTRYKERSHGHTEDSTQESLVGMILRQDACLNSFSHFQKKATATAGCQCHYCLEYQHSRAQNRRILIFLDHGHKGMIEWFGCHFYTLWLYREHALIPTIAVVVQHVLLQSFASWMMLSISFLWLMHV